MTKKQNNLPGLGGSDAHKPDCVGFAYTDIPEGIISKTEPVNYIRSEKPVSYAIIEEDWRCNHCVRFCDLVCKKREIQHFYRISLIK